MAQWVRATGDGHSSTSRSPALRRSTSSHTAACASSARAKTQGVVLSQHDVEPEVEPSLGIGKHCV
jgi:hypothetical protein